MNNYNTLICSDRPDIFKRRLITEKYRIPTETLLNGTKLWRDKYWRVIRKDISPYHPIIHYSPNTIYSQYSVITGGQNNTLQPSSQYSVITGGTDNTIQTSSQYSVIVGGH